MRRSAFPGLRADLIVLRLGLVAVLACAPAPDVEPTPRSTLFVGVDVSGSFEQGGRYDDAMAFAAHYIHGHINGLGGLEEPRALFVGAIGGDEPGQPQAFHPIHDFQGKGVAAIEADLREWFPPRDLYTDFAAFFDRAATLVKRQNLALAPVTLVLLTDGVPDLGADADREDPAARYQAIDLDALEYLARNVTVRVLYPDPEVAVRWERDVPRDRVRMWTVDAVVMNGWRAQLAMADPAGGGAGEPAAVDAPTPAGEPARASVTETTGELASGVVRAMTGRSSGPSSSSDIEPVPADAQPDLWRWIRDNVDFRVRRSVF